MSAASRSMAIGCDDAIASISRVGNRQLRGKRWSHGRNFRPRLMPRHHIRVMVRRNILAFRPDPGCWCDAAARSDDAIGMLAALLTPLSESEKPSDLWLIASDPDGRISRFAAA